MEGVCSCLPLTPQVPVQNWYRHVSAPSCCNLNNPVSEPAGDLAQSLVVLLGRSAVSQVPIDLETVTPRGRVAALLSPLKEGALTPTPGFMQGAWLPSDLVELFGSYFSLLEWVSHYHCLDPDLEPSMPLSFTLAHCCKFLVPEMLPCLWSQLSLFGYLLIFNLSLLCFWRWKKL